MSHAAPLKGANTPWMVSPSWDLTLMVGLPLVTLAILMAFNLHFTVYEIYAFIFAVFSLGHHLPGFIRAYGDKSVFTAHRWVFLLAPPLVFASILSAIYLGFKTFGTLIVIWSIWHAFMQFYGILRLYDAKAKATSPISAAMDRSLSILLFISTYLFWHKDNAFNIFSTLVSSGIPGVSPSVYTFLNEAIPITLGIFTVIYLLYHVRLAVKKQAYSSVKVALALSMTAFCFAAFSQGFISPILAICVAEICHDVQYAAVGYVGARRAATTGNARGTIISWMFKGSAIAALTYIGVLGLYGSLNFAGNMISINEHPNLAYIFAAFVGTSSILHYYFDSFIWRRAPASLPPKQGLLKKLNQKITSLGPKVIQPAIAAALVLFFAWNEMRTTPDVNVQSARELVDLLPTSEKARLQLGATLRMEGQWAPAEATFRKALSLNPDSARAHMELGRLMSDRNFTTAADSHLQKAVLLDPNLRHEVDQVHKRSFARLFQSP